MFSVRLRLMCATVAHSGSAQVFSPHPRGTPWQSWRSDVSRFAHDEKLSSGVMCRDHLGLRVPWELIANVHGRAKRVVHGPGNEVHYVVEPNCVRTGRQSGNADLERQTRYPRSREAQR
jgi:hypothetical protein